MATPCLDEATSKEVLRQVEYYFSDSNIPRDKFLRNAIQSSFDGLVDLNLICSFKKMRNYLKLEDVKPEEIQEDTLKAVVDTLRKSKSLKISDDGKKVGRVSELPITPNVIEQLDARTVAVSPLKYDVKREDVESFFNEYAMVSSVRLPRHVLDKKAFCGSALVEFSSEKDAENALGHNFVFDSIKLDVIPKKDFDAEREKMSVAIVKPFKNGSKHSFEEPDYPKGLIVSFKLKKKVSSDESSNLQDSKKDESRAHSEDNATEKGNSEENAPQAKTVEDEGDDNNSEKEETNEVKNNFEERKNDKNVVLREDLKEILEKFGTVKFIDFKIGEECGYVRFEEPETAQKVRAAAVLSEEGGLVVKNFIVTFEQVSGDPEKEYWKLLRGGQSMHRENRGGRGRGRGRGGRHKQTRSADRESNDRPNKSQKVHT